MTEEQDNKTTQQGQAEGLHNQSQVKKEKSLLWQGKWLHGLVMAGVVVLVIVLMMVGGQSKKKPEHKPTPANPTQDYASELATNLAKLQANQSTLPSPPIPHRMHFTQQVTKPKLSKAYLARQNAPTKLYSAPPDNSQSGVSNNSTSRATFAGKGAYAHFGNQSTQPTTVLATRIAHPRETIASGEFIHAILETAINSDLPGMVRAVISQPVYAYVGETPLIPAGSRLIGQYAATVFQGMKRLFVIWNRVILPNGISVQINSPGTDNLGRAGMGANHINTHFFARFGEATLLSVIGAGVATYDVGNQDQYNSASMYRAAIAHSFQQSAQRSLQHSLPTKPTLFIDQGTKINVFVARDLSFYKVLQANTQAASPTTQNNQGIL